MPAWPALPASAFALLLCCAASPVKALEIAVHYLRLEVPAPPTLTEMDTRPEDLGLAGARLGLADNATTGGFLGHDYRLQETLVPEDGDWAAAVKAALEQGNLLLLEAPAEAQIAAADIAEAAGQGRFCLTSPPPMMRCVGPSAGIASFTPCQAGRCGPMR